MTTATATATATATTTTALLSAHNRKLTKGSALGWATYGLSLEPGVRMCPVSAQAGCLAPCLRTVAGNAFHASTRAKRVEWLGTDRAGFLRVLDHEVRLLSQTYRQLAIRLNLLSDVPWESRPYHINGQSLMERHPEVTWYDYTKMAGRARSALPANYSLTLSFWENGTANNFPDCQRWLAEGRNVAVIFDVGRGKPLPALWRGYPVIDGDESDLRFLDPKGSIVGLRYKTAGVAGAKAQALAQGLIQIGVGA